MSGFEFGLVPVAIIIGFALTKILNAWGHVVRRWSTLHKPWMLLSFSGFAMVGILSHFVGDWAYRDIELNLGRLVLIILPTLLMVMAISVILPTDDDWPSDLLEHYFCYSRQAAGLFCIAIALSIVPDLLPGASGVPELWMIASFVFPLVLMAVTRNHSVHVVCHVVLWAMALLQMSSLTGFGLIR